MTVDEVKLKREELRNSIGWAIRRFQDETGCLVDSVDLDRYTNTFGLATIPAISVNVIIKLP